MPFLTDDHKSMLYWMMCTCEHYAHLLLDKNGPYRSLKAFQETTRRCGKGSQWKKANTMAIKRTTEQHMNASLASSSSKSTKRKQSISSKSSSFPSSKKLLCFSYQASQQATEEGYVRRRQWWPLLSCFFLPRVTSRETKSCFCRCCITRNIEGNEKEK